MRDDPPTRTGHVGLSTEPVDRLTRSFDRFLRIEAAEELTMRAALNFPPYSKLLNILAYGSADLAGNMMKIISESAEPVEILGPTEKKTKKGIEYSFLLRHSERRVLHALARAVVKRFKNIKDIEIRIDADPY